MQSVPAILQIYQDRLKPGAEAAYRAIEEDAARICVRMKFPHAHLAIESLADSLDVWWLNAFESEEDRQQVIAEYLSNPALVAALDGIGRRKDGLTERPIDDITTYRADLSSDVVWELAGARFFVVVTGAEVHRLAGHVFEAPSGTQFGMRPVSTREKADALAADAGAGAKVFAVRPYWGMPAREWIAADPEFWQANPKRAVSLAQARPRPRP